MPVYCFRTEDGEVVEKTLVGIANPDFTIPEEITLEDGRTAKRDLQAEHGGFLHPVANWPQECDLAACVNPKQVKDTSEFLAKKGCPTEVKPNGNMVFRDRNHRARALRTLGWFDRSAGYSDPN